MKDISNQHESPIQVTHPNRSKWTRIARSAPSISKILDVHLENKSGSKPILDHHGLPKKTKLVSQVDKESDMLLADVGS